MINEEKGQKIISMFLIAQDYKKIVKTKDKFTQINIATSIEIEQKLVMTE